MKQKIVLKSKLQTIVGKDYGGYRTEKEGYIYTVVKLVNGLRYHIGDKLDEYEVTRLVNDTNRNDMSLTVEIV